LDPFLKYIYKIIFRIYKKIFIFNRILKLNGDWGLGIGDWGLGIGPNPQSPIPNPQSPIPIIPKLLFLKKLIKNNFYQSKIHF